MISGKKKETKRKEEIIYKFVFKNYKSNGCSYLGQGHIGNDIHTFSFHATYHRINGGGVEANALFPSAIRPPADPKSPLFVLF